MTGGDHVLSANLGATQQMASPQIPKSCIYPKNVLECSEWTLFGLESGIALPLLLHLPTKVGQQETSMENYINVKTRRKSGRTARPWNFLPDTALSNSSMLIHRMILRYFSNQAFLGALKTGSLHTCWRNISTVVVGFQRFKVGKDQLDSGLSFWQWTDERIGAWLLTRTQTWGTGGHLSVVSRYGLLYCRSLPKFDACWDCFVAAWLRCTETCATVLLQHSRACSGAAEASDHGRRDLKCIQPTMQCHGEKNKLQHQKRLHYGNYT